jgi:hypothetical protein
MKANTLDEFYVKMGEAFSEIARLRAVEAAALSVIPFLVKMQDAGYDEAYEMRLRIQNAAGITQPWRDDIRVKVPGQE